MQIVVSEIPPEGLVVDVTRDRAWFEGNATGEALDRFFTEDIEFHCTIERMGRQVAIRGTLEFDCSAACTRCLEHFPMLISNDFFYAMTPVTSRLEMERDLELAAEDLEMGLYESDCIDLEPLLVEQAMLQIPVQTVCDDRCRGLCQVCGANLNRINCGHETTMKADSPFAVLKNYKVPGKRS